MSGGIVVGAVRITIAGLIATLALAGAGGVASGAEDGVQFRDPLTNEPLEIEVPPDASEEVKRFFQTGENPYHGDEQAIEEGCSSTTAGAPAAICPTAPGGSARA
jgi:hypothetical protein